MNDFVSTRVCFYSSMFEGESNMHHIIEYAHQKGVFGVEMMNFCDELQVPDMSQAKELGKLAHGYNLRLPCFSVGINLVEGKQEAMKQLAAYADICSELEIPYLHHTIFSRLDSVPYTREQKEEIFKEGLERSLEINEYAKKRGVQTVIEDQGPVFNGCDLYCRLLTEAKGRLLPLFDVGNILFAEEKPEVLLKSLTLPVVHVHLKDYKIITDDKQPADYITEQGTRISTAEMGLGDLDLHSIAAQLKAQNYKGAYALEFEKGVDSDEMDRVLQRMTEIFG